MAVSTTTIVPNTERMFANAMDRESAIRAAKLVQALETSTYTFVRTLRECTIQKMEITHSSGLVISVCDSSYEHLTIKEPALSWIRRDFCPLSGPLMIIFGVAEEWRFASNRPSRQVIFIIGRDGVVMAYDRGVMFYICPSLQDFWTADIVFEHDNSIFPSPLRRYVKQLNIDLKDLMGFYNKLRLQRVIIESKEKRQKSGTVLPLKCNRLMRILISAASAIQQGSIPPLFSDRATLHQNVDMGFLEMYWKSRRYVPQQSPQNGVVRRNGTIILESTPRGSQSIQSTPCIDLAAASPPIARRAIEGPPMPMTVTLISSPPMFRVPVNPVPGGGGVPSSPVPVDLSVRGPAPGVHVLFGPVDEEDEDDNNAFDSVRFAVSPPRDHTEPPCIDLTLDSSEDQQEQPMDLTVNGSPPVALSYNGCIQVASVPRKRPAPEDSRVLEDGSVGAKITKTEECFEQKERGDAQLWGPAVMTTSIVLGAEGSPRVCDRASSDGPDT
ncbi:M38 protein [Murid betaherpesvirus 1]|uniref:M38 protein n=1 Tax=Murid herpesvirus 1 TaxID=10366 RepID=H2A272_MUHV1|nr:M38 protein [Murid betaherpesvirus 1]